MSLLNTFKTPESTLDPKQLSRVMHLLIRNREKVIYDGDAMAVSSVNDHGPFDVLGQHINFISIIKEYIKILKTDNTTQEYKLRTGLMKVNGNKIEIYVGISELPSSTSGKIATVEKTKGAKPDILKRLAKVMSRSDASKDPVV